MHIIIEAMPVDLNLHTVHLAVCFLAKCLSSPRDSPTDTGRNTEESRVRKWLECQIVNKIIKSLMLGKDI